MASASAMVSKFAVGSSCGEEVGTNQRKRLVRLNGSDARRTVSGHPSEIAGSKSQPIPGRDLLRSAMKGHTSSPVPSHFRDFSFDRLRRRTPGPSPFSSMNTTPAASRARRTAKSFATVREVSSSASSARLIVLSPNADSRARSSALHLRRARAARIWELLNPFTFIVRPAVCP
jgi:hypothetical protein